MSINPYSRRRLYSQSRPGSGPARRAYPESRDKGASQAYPESGGASRADRPGFSLDAYLKEREKGFDLTAYLDDQTRQAIRAGTWTRQDQAAEKWLRQVQAFIGNTAQAYDGRQGTYQTPEAFGAYRQAAGETLEELIRRGYETRGHYTRFAGDYDGAYGEGVSARVLEDIGRALTGLQDVRQGLESEGAFRGQFADENAWNSYQAHLRVQDYAETIPQAEDFAEFSRYVSTYRPGTEEFNAFGGFYKNTGFGDIRYDYINGNALARERENMLETSLGQTFLGLDRGEQREMTDEEVAVFDYLYAVRGKEEAYRYIDDLTATLNLRERMRRQEEWGQSAAERPVLTSAFSVLESPLRGLSYLGQAADYLEDGQIDQNEGYNKFSHIPGAIRQRVSSDIEEAVEGFWGKAGSFAYQTGMSMGDFLMNTGVTGGSKALTLAIMGTGAAADATISAKDRGLSDNQSFALGTIAGMAEVVTEYFSLDALLNMDLEQGAVRYILRNAFVEGSEEVGSDIINAFADLWIAQDQAILRQNVAHYREQGEEDGQALFHALLDGAGEAALDFLGGFLSGGVMAAGPAGVNTMVNYQSGRYLDSLRLTPEAVRALVDKGLASGQETRANALAQAAAGKLDAGGALSVYELGDLYQSNIRAVDAEAQGEALLRQAALEVSAGNRLSSRQTGAILESPAALRFLTAQTGVEIRDDMSRAQRRNAVREAVAALANMETETDVSEVTEVSEAPGEALLKQAAEEVSDGRRLSNRQAEAILADPEALRLLLERSGADLGDAVTKSQRRNAVRDAVAALAGQDVVRDVSQDVGQEAGPVLQTEQVRPAARQVHDALLLERSAAALGENGARALRTAYDGSAAAADFFPAFAAYYQAGMSGMETDRLHGRYGDTLTEAQKYAAFAAGRNDAAASLARERAAAPYAKTAGAESGLVYDDFVREAVESGRTRVDVNGENRVYLTAEDAEKINRVAKALGVRVRFVDIVGEGEGNASINGSEIQVERNNPNPVMAIVGHEFTHRLQKLSPDAYRAFRDAAMGDQTDLEDRVERRMEDYARKGHPLSREAAMDEVAADYAGRMMDDGRVLDDFLKKHSGERTLLEKIRDVFHALWLRLTGREKARARDAERKLTAALEAAARQAAENAQKKTAQEGGEVRFSLKMFEDGKRFVDVEADQAQFDGLSPADMRRIATRIIKERFAGRVIGLDHPAFVNGRTAMEYGHPVKRVSGDLYEAKMRASTELDNLIDAGTNFRTEPDGRDGHIHPAAVGDFQYFDTIFKVGGEYYQGVINIQPVSRGLLLKDVTKIRNITQDICSSYGPNPKSAFLRDASMRSVPQEGGDVKTRFSLKEAQAAYAGRSLTEDGFVYSYDFLTALPDMPVTVLPEVDAVRDAGRKVDSRAAVELGMKNARDLGTTRDGKVFVRNRYTGKQLQITGESIRHGLNGELNRLLTNARLGAKIGELAQNAVPINALRNKAGGVTGTYAMAAYAVDSKGREFAAILTVEQRTGRVVDFEAYDLLHAISGRQKRSSQASTKLQGLYPIKAADITIADFLEVVNSTHKSILSEDVLARLGETKSPAGEYTDKVRYSLKTFEDGRRFVDVDIDQERFAGLTTSQMQAEAIRVINEKFKGKVIGVEYTAYVNRNSARHYAYPANRRMAEVQKLDKMRASPELDNLILASTFRENVPDDGRHPAATGGIDKLDTVFRVNGRIYQAEISVLVTDHGRVFYDLTKMKDITGRKTDQTQSAVETSGDALSITQDISSSYGPSPQTTFLRDASMRSVPQEGGDVKTRFSIKQTADGKKYVQADRQVIFGNDPASWGEQVEDYINGKIRRGQDVTLLTEDGDILLLTAETAGKAKHAYHPDGTPLTADQYWTKVNAEAHIDELAQVSTRGQTKPDAGGRHGDFASGGWQYRTAYFQDFDGQYYLLHISVAQGTGGNVVYNIGDIRKRSLPTVTGSSVKDGALMDGEASPQDSISQSGRDVKSSLKSGTISKSYEALLRENDLLRNRVDYWRGQTRKSKQATTDRGAVQKTARALLKDYRSGADLGEITAGLQGLYDFLASGQDGENELTYEAARERAAALARELIENAAETEDGLYQEYAGLRSYLRSTELRFGRDYQAGWTDFGAFRRGLMGRLRLRTGGTGTNIDKVYEELSDRWPEFFDSARETSPEEQLGRISEVLDALYDVREINPYAGSFREAETGAVNDILERFFDLPQTRATFADRQALRLQEAKAAGQNRLANQRARDAERLEKLRLENRERTARAVERERQRRTEAIENLKERYREKDAARRERQSAREIRAKIVRHVKSLSQRLLRPTDSQHIPEGLRTAAAALLESVNLESLYTVDPETGKRRKNGSGDPAKRTEAFRALREQYRSIARGETDFTGVLDPDMLEDVDRVLALRSVPLDAMTSGQLETVWKVIRGLENAVATADKLLGQSRFQSVLALAEAVRSGTVGRRVKSNWGGVAGTVNRALTLDMLNPMTFFHRLGPGGDALFSELQAARDQKTRILNETRARVASVIGKEDIRALREKSRTFEVEGGALTLTVGQIMSLYALSKRPQAQDHIYKGGLRPASSSGTVEGGTALDRAAAALGRLEAPSAAVSVTAADVSAILETMTDTERRIADGLQGIMQGYLADQGNLESMRVYGYKKFTEANYFPIASDPHQIQDKIGDVLESGERRPRSIAEWGSAKNTTPKANNALLLGDIFDIFSQHAVDMATYASHLGAMEDLNRVRHFRFRGEDGAVTGTMGDILHRMTGQHGGAYLNKLLQDISAGTAKEKLGDLGRLTANYKAASVGANMRVALQQPTSYLRAAAVIDPKYLADPRVLRKGGWEKALQYAPIAVWKSWGNFEINQGRQIQNVFFGTDTNLERARSAAMGLAEKMDSLTWSRIWNACELEVRDRQADLSPGSAAFYEAVGRRFTDIIDATQVVDNVLGRSQFMRSGDNLYKMAASYMGEPTQSYNLVYRALSDLGQESGGEGRTRARKTLGRALTALLTSQAAGAVAQALWDAVRDDDRERKYWERVLKAIPGNFLDNINPANMVPFFKDIWSIFRGYDVKRMDTAAIASFLEACRNVDKAVQGEGRYTLAGSLANLAAEGARLFGLPAATVKRDVLAVVRSVAVETGDWMVQYRLERLLSRVGYAGNRGDFYDIAFGALRDGQTDVYEEIAADLMAQGVKPSALEKAMRDRLAAAREAEPGLTLSQRALDLMGYRERAETKEAQLGFSPDDLSPASYRQFSRDRAESYRTVMDALETIPGFAGLDEETRARVLAAADTLSEKTALASASGGQYEMDVKWMRWAAGGEAYGVSEAEAILFKAAYDMTSGDIGENGVTVPGSRKENVLEAAEEMMPGLTDEELAYLMSNYWK